MKKLILFFLVIAIVISTGVVVNSCKRAHLDLLPHGPTEQTFFTKEADFDKAVLGVYAKVNDFFWYNGGQFSTTMPAFLLPGDDITINDDDEFEQFGSLQSSSPRLDYLYRAHYQVIARANLVLDKIAKVEPGIYVTANLSNHHKGEALFLRGYGFYNLWNIFGTSPLDTVRVTSSAQFTPPGTTGTQLLDQAIADFTAAAALLPATWSAANRGRATSNSANGMLGKALVFKASANKSTAEYTQAITAFNKIAGASLVARFDDNFAFDTENNSESLFEYQATQAFAGDNVWLPNDFDNAIGNLSIFWGFYDNNFALFGRSPMFATDKLLNAYNAADPRRNLTLNPADKTIRKYVTRNKLSQSNVGSVNNYRILRLADVLLLKAEAILQSGGSTSEAIGLINDVRARARSFNGSAEPANYSTAQTDKTVIMGWIMNERLLEMAAEGQRWFDLRRWQMQGIITLNSAFFSSNSASINFQSPKHLVFPIPTSETDVNPNVPQNTGY